MKKAEISEEKPPEKDSWDLIIALRLYLIVFFIMAPAIHLSFQLFYVQPISIIIFGVSLLLILRFVLFEPRSSSEKYQKISIRILIPLACLIIGNFIIGLIIQILHLNLTGIFFHLFISIGSVVYFKLTVPKKRFKGLNSRLVSWKSIWSSRGNHKNLRQHIFALILICIIGLSTVLVFVPYPVYIQRNPGTLEDQRIGFWVGSGMNLTDDTMEMFADADVYFVTTVKKGNLNDNLGSFLNRCKAFDVEVHISMAKKYTKYSFVNVWTFEELSSDIDDIIEWLEDKKLLGKPVTTVVYDMEGLVGSTFIEYLMNSDATSKLSEYYKVKEQFIDFNKHLREDYDLDVQICGDFVQGFDLKDGDDDIISFYGLLYDAAATNSYMIYRKDFFGLNYVLDSCRLFKKGNTIIINSWKFTNCFCWGDLDCVIEEARLILGYPNKKYNLEIWRLDNFLDSYGLTGLEDFIEALTENPSSWPDIYVWYGFPNSLYTDGIFYLFSILDFYAPLFKIIYRSY